MTPERLEQLRTTYRDGLLDNVLPFWLRHCVDREHGGFTMALDRDGTRVDTDKGMWQQGRFTWLLGELYNTVEPRDEWLCLCKHGIDFMERHGFDSADGRMWFHVTRDGRPIRKRRYAFTESFAAIAYGEYAKATGESWAADKAAALFKRFVDLNLDPQGVEPKFTDTRPSKAIGFPMIAIATAQELRDAIDLPGADTWIDRSIASIRDDFCKPDLRVVMEEVAPDGSIIVHFDGRTLNPGHAIEGAWFIMHESERRGDDALVRLGCDMLDWMWERGWDDEYGGLLYFVDLHGGPVQEYWHDMKIWWPHNEALIATLYAHHLTGDNKYATWHDTLLTWCLDHFADAEHNEWFGYLRRDGAVSSTLKGNLWKGPFHLPRQQLMCWRLVERMLATSDLPADVM